MRRSSIVVSAFLLSAVIPFGVTYAVFLYSQRAALLTEPERYIAAIKSAGTMRTFISPRSWKYVLAQDPMCTEAEILVIGSSRVAEVDDGVVGGRMCNLWVPLLNARTFTLLVDALPRVPAGARRLAYVGLDHIFFWSVEEDADWVELSRVSRLAWRAWKLVAPLTFFSIGDVSEAIQRHRRERAGSAEPVPRLWYADGHMSYPRYYARKHAGRHPPVGEREIETLVDEEFHGVRFSDGYVRAFERGIRELHAKGYVVRVYWNPVSPTVVAVARVRYPRLFRRPIEVVDSLASHLPIDRYVPAGETLDAARFGCTPSDQRDASHVDVDCMARFFATEFNPRQEVRRPAPGATSAVRSAALRR
jgi:hypothetical protein